MRFFLCLACLALSGLWSCATPSPPADPPSSPAVVPDTTVHTIEDILTTHTDSLMALDGVTGVGQALCDGSPCLRIYVQTRTPELATQLPDAIDGYPVEIVETGQIRPHRSDG